VAEEACGRHQSSPYSLGASLLYGGGRRAFLTSLFCLSVFPKGSAPGTPNKQLPAFGWTTQEWCWWVKRVSLDGGGFGGQRPWPGRKTLTSCHCLRLRFLAFPTLELASLRQKVAYLDKEFSKAQKVSSSTHPLLPSTYLPDSFTQPVNTYSEPNLMLCAVFISSFKDSPWKYL
jgi:hypothetical protein